MAPKKKIFVLAHLDKKTDIKKKREKYRKIYKIHKKVKKYQKNKVLKKQQKLQQYGSKKILLLCNEYVCGLGKIWLE